MLDATWSPNSLSLCRKGYVGIPDPEVQSQQIAIRRFVAVAYCPDFSLLSAFGGTRFEYVLIDLSQIRKPFLPVVEYLASQN